MAAEVGKLLKVTKSYTGVKQLTIEGNYLYKTDVSYIFLSVLGLPFSAIHDGQLFRLHMYKPTL